MDIQTITLFIACLLFASVNLLTNTKVHRESWIKYLTLFFGLAGLTGAGYLLLLSFYNLIVG